MISGPTWATLSGVGLLLACSAEPPVAASRQPIVEGVESGPEQDGVLLSARSGEPLARRRGKVFFELELNQPLYYERAG